MAKYRKKSMNVDAEIYKAGMEDGFIDYCTWDRLRDCTSKFDSNCKNTCSYYTKIPYINTYCGRGYLRPGDYIVTDEQGNRSAVIKDKFEYDYEYIGK